MGTFAACEARISPALPSAGNVFGHEQRQPGTSGLRLRAAILTGMRRISEQGTRRENFLKRAVVRLVDASQEPFDKALADTCHVHGMITDSGEPQKIAHSGVVPRDQREIARSRNAMPPQSGNRP